jgi:hypothetical protein
MLGDSIMQTKQPDLAGFLSDIPESGLEPLKDQLAQRAKGLAGNGDEESRAWSSLYGFLQISIEEAQLRRLGVTL